jgi:hypothetical protein
LTVPEARTVFQGFAIHERRCFAVGFVLIRHRGLYKEDDKKICELIKKGTQKIAVENGCFFQGIESL